MTGITSTSTRRSHRRRLHVARGVTVLGIGVAAIASCQRFRDIPLLAPQARDAQLSDIDDCAERGGHWNIDDWRCADADADAGTPRDSRALAGADEVRAVDADGPTPELP